MLLTLLLGVVGLVIDGGLLFAAHRNAHNAADTAALTAAMDKLIGQTDATATAAATNFVQNHNGLSNATVICNFPPTTGPHAGQFGYVEAIVTVPIRTLFIHFLGINPNQQVRGRAVATFSELRTAGEGAIVLDPRVGEAPGLAVGGQGRLVVQGGVFDNNEGGGVDYLYQPVNENISWAATGGQTNSENGVYSDNIRIVGGVDDPAMFKNIATGTPVPNVLWAGVLPIPDPLVSLETPSTANGVIDTAEWPDVTVSTNGVNVNPNPATSVDTSDPLQVVLYPDVYKQITISGGNVKFMPGIYVVRAGGNKGISITGGNIIGEGIMFYNTGANYKSDTGEPDINDPFDPMGLQPPPSPNQAATQLGDVTLNSSLNFTGIDTQNPALDYSGMPGIGVFDGMLFYQRRGNAHAVALQGNGSTTFLAGTIYAKWSRFKLQGTAQYDAQFIVGSMDIQGQGDVTLQYTGQGRGKAPTVYLVE